MKNWQNDGLVKATKSNVPHLYLYTWIRASGWCFTILNSVIILILTKDMLCLEIILLALGLMRISFFSRKYDRSLPLTILDILLMLLFAFIYILDVQKIGYLYCIELICIIYFSIKIEKDNNIIDNHKIVLWWRHKKQEHRIKEIKTRVEENKKRRVDLQMTEEEKMKRLSRHQRKQNKKQRNGR